MSSAECEEEQTNEIAAIESIFAADYREVSKSPPCYELVILPEQAGDNHVLAILRITYPADYPHVAPSIKVVGNKGLEPSHVAALQTVIDEAITANIGMVLVYTVAEAVREWLLARNVAEKTMHEAMMERAASDTAAQAAAVQAQVQPDVPERIPLVAMGTLTTRESFADWQKLFAAEQAEIEARNKPAVVVEVKEQRMTGRQIFERNLSLGLEEEAGDDQAEEVFWFNEAAYADDDPALHDDDDANGDSNAKDYGVDANDDDDGDEPQQRFISTESDDENEDSATAAAVPAPAAAPVINKAEQKAPASAGAKAPTSAKPAPAANSAAKPAPSKPAAPAAAPAGKQQDKGGKDSGKGGGSKDSGKNAGGKKGNDGGGGGGSKDKKGDAGNKGKDKGAGAGGKKK